MNLPRSASRSHGFSLVELLATISVLLILAVLAVPSFSQMRQRAAIRGAADATLAFWNEARFEAVKRNQLVKVGVFVGSNGEFCLGAATTEDPADATPCDCRSAAPAANACNVQRYPTNQSEWSGVTLAGHSLGGSMLPTPAHPAVIEPMRSGLTEANDAGSITLGGPSGAQAYQLRLAVDRLGRGRLCQPTSATQSLPDYATRLCAN
jgi:prepilin-type N-terminal cleavage/methylation domain-containing protein